MMKSNKKQQQQTTMDLFMKRDTSSRTASGRSIGGISEEGIVIIENDSSICVVAPEDLPVGHDMGVEASNIQNPDHV